MKVRVKTADRQLRLSLSTHLTGWHFSLVELHKRSHTLATALIGTKKKREMTLVAGAPYNCESRVATLREVIVSPYSFSSWNLLMIPLQEIYTRLDIIA